MYEEPSSEDGKRILVDRLWPRGLKKEHARIDYWAKEIAPSNGLRNWFNHDPNKWNEFKMLYFKELDANTESVLKLKSMLKNKKTTLLFSSKELRLNNAVALGEYLKSNNK